MANATSDSVASSRLFKLPPELRLRVYEYTLCSEDRVEITKDQGIPEPALLLTCKTIRDEAIMSFYNQNRFNLIVRSYDPAVSTLWGTKLRHLPGSYRQASKNSNNYHTGPRLWSNLKLSLRLRHSGKLLIKSRIKLPGSTKYSDEKFFIAGLFRAVGTMRGEGWEEVDSVLEMLRPGLVKFNTEWSL